LLTDNDDIPDGWEFLNFFNPLNKTDSEDDFDADGLSNLREYISGTDPRDQDTDNDGLIDSDEIDVYGTNPTDNDTDDDGFSDGREVELGYDPLNPVSNPTTISCIMLLVPITTIVIFSILVKKKKLKA
ncbi:MAG: hypothetical protein Q6363_000650, partial [Candidatus Njordarchaeota archaeon]